MQDLAVVAVPHIRGFLLLVGELIEAHQINYIERHANKVNP